MILNIHKRENNGSILKKVFGGNFSFDYLPEYKKLHVYQSTDIYDYNIEAINVGLHGYIVDAFLCEEE